MTLQHTPEAPIPPPEAARPPFPRAEREATLALLREGYGFGPRRYGRLGSDVFRTRLMLREAYFTMGEDAARMFYHSDRFTRRGAVPPTTVMLLQDFGSVQAKSGAEHRHRKALFMGRMTPDGIADLARRTAAAWRERIDAWERQAQVVLHPEVQRILTRAVCAWAGVPVARDEADRRAREFAAMIDGAGAVGPRNWRGLALRARTERWARAKIEGIRAGRLDAPEGSPAHAVAWHREPDGELLDTKIAGVELINFLRPTVAVARFITFAALALHRHADAAARLRSGDEAYLDGFVQEVRRFYPFFPAVAGRAREPFEWRGHRFAEGAWVFLDLYATNHDPRLWDQPEAFRPERFEGREIGAYTLIPQGAGDHHTGHRCAGEWVTIALVKEAVRLLTREMRYRVPDQDLSIDLSRMPALPETGLILTEVRTA